MGALKYLLMIGASVVAFLFSLMLINNLPEMFSSLQSSILSSTVIFIILIILVRVILKSSKSL